MEVLAIVAYRQPITMAEIDAARGVQSDYSLRQLLERRLVEEVGRKQTPGRPVLYGTTQQFLHQFGLNTTDDLPPLSAELMDLGQVEAVAQGTELPKEDEKAVDEENSLPHEESGPETSEATPDSPESAISVH